MAKYLCRLRARRHEIERIRHQRRRPEMLFQEFVVKDEAWLYRRRADGETRSAGGGRRATISLFSSPRRRKVVEKLLPVMQVGLHAASLVNGVAGVVRLFGRPCSCVPDAGERARRDSVEILKQESSVERFAAVHEKVQEGDEATERTRGGALRDLEDFINRIR